jgi:pimeloyl-ACP methyl ester carboxylesterase
MNVGYRFANQIIMKRRSGLVFALMMFVSALPLGAQSVSSVLRKDFYVESEPGIRICLREIRSESAGSANGPILLVHGARVPGIASFDLPVPGGSLAEDLANSGFIVYVIDIRGYGRSTRPKEMSEPAENNAPLVRSTEAVRDIDAAVDFIRRQTGRKAISILGWATGGQWAGYYATLHSTKLSHLVIHNALYGAGTAQLLVGHGSDLEDPARPGQFNSTVGAYRWNTANSLLGVWDKSIPTTDKNEWRDPTVADAYVREALGSDPTAAEHNPPAFRSPNGALEDSFYLATGRQLWDASFITIPTLVIASERDIWSRPGDRELLFAHLVHTRTKRLTIIPDATHFVHLDRNEHGRKHFLDEVVQFCSSN